MRAWIPAQPEHLTSLQSSAQFACEVGFVVTPEWSESWDETDPEVLEAQMLDDAGQHSRLVIVGECQGSVTNAQTGQIQIMGLIIKANVYAIFAANAADSQDFLWFGPTELPEALAWHSS